MQGAVGARASPPASQQSGNLFIALMTPRWIHLETDLLMSGDGAGIPPREACRASSPGGAMGVWSETGGAGTRDLGSVWENHRKISCLSIPSCWGATRRQSGEGSLRWRKRHHWAPVPAAAPNCLWPGPRFLSFLGRVPIFQEDAQVLPTVSTLSQGVGRIRSDTTTALNSLEEKPL